MKPIVVSLFAACLATAMLMPSTGEAETATDSVVKAMAALKDQTAKMGLPKIEGTDAVGGKDAPALYFGSTKMNNNNALVDAVAREGGIEMAATLFVKSGDEYISVATTFPNRDGDGRALGTGFHSPGPGPRFIKAGKPWSGPTVVFARHFSVSYEPIKDASGEMIGAYFVGEELSEGEPLEPR